MVDRVLEDAFDRCVGLGNKGELIDDQKDPFLPGMPANIFKGTLPSVKGSVEIPIKMDLDRF